MVKPHSREVVQMWFELDSRAVCDCDVTIHGLIAVRDFKPHLKFKRIVFPSSVFVCGRRIFLFFVTAKLPCHLVMCERTSNYSHRLITVTTRRTQLQPCSNCRVNDATDVIVRCWNLLTWLLIHIQRQCTWLLGFKPIPECATLNSRVSDQGRICDFIYWV